MARYPTFEDYEKRGNYQDGIKKCNDLLKKSPNDVQLLIVKLQLLYASEGDAEAVLDQLLSIQPPIVRLDEVLAIEEAVVKSQRDTFPRPNAAGPKVAKLWENAFKASGSTNHKLDLMSLRFSRAIVDNRLADAQQALIQLKGLQPKRRVIYMAHAAITQLLSTSKDDLQSRLALSLARKAVSERFDDNSLLDCRVPGQIFAIQDSTKDLESIANRSFKESKQAYDAFRRAKDPQVNGVASTQQLEPQSVSATEWLSAEEQTLKQQFANITESSASTDIVLIFAKNAVQLFRTVLNSISGGHGRAAANSCFLAISALVRAFEQTNHLRHLLQAAYLAEALLKHDTHIHEARVILIYLYMRLSLGSLALQYFDSLSVKEIQHDTVGHALFTRLSHTHPLSTELSKTEKFDPYKRTSHALSVYTRCEDKLAETEASVLEHEQTGMIFDLHELRDSLRSSISRRITHLEQRRLGRLIHTNSGEDVNQLGPRTTANWITVTDTRDFAATFDYGYNVEKALHGFQGHLPGKYWILNTLAADCAWCLAMGFQTPMKDPENIIQELNTAVLDLGHLKLDDDAASTFGMTDAEYLAGDLACQVLKMLLHLTTSPAELSEDVKSVEKSMERLNLDALVNATPTLSEGLRDHYVYVDVLRIVASACRNARDKVNECKEDLQRLQERSIQHMGGIQAHAASCMKSVDAAGVKGFMEQGGEVWEVIKTLGDDETQGFYESVTTSAKEGWGGVATIKAV